MFSVVLYTISQMHGKVNMTNIAILDCFMNVAKYIAPSQGLN